MAQGNDVTPNLTAAIWRDFSHRFNEDAQIRSIYGKVQNGTATYKEAAAFADRAGELLSGAFQRNLSADVLPGGKMYYHIAEGILNYTLPKDHALISNVCEKVQKTLNEAAGIHLKAQVPQLNQNRIDGFINRLASEDDYDKVSWILDEPVKTFSRSVVDDAIKTNADFQYSAGLTPKIRRISEANCCAWCSGLAGEYDYPVDEEIYRRHNNCRCVVEYYPGDGRKQNAHTKTWSEDESRNDRITKANGIRKQMLANQESRKRDRLLNYGSGRYFESDYSNIKARKLEQYTLNNIFVEDGIKLSRGSAKRIDSQISRGKSILGIEGSCKSPVVIVRDNMRLASYNPRTDTFFISSNMLDSKRIVELQQGFACSENPDSTIVHELIHWKDAEFYRSSGKIISSATETSEYTMFQRNLAFKTLQNAGVDTGSIAEIKKNISQYAARKAIENDWEEVYTEYRTKLILNGD